MDRQNWIMDIVSFLRFIIEHNDKIIGSLIALFIATAILLLWRSIGEKNAGGGAGTSDIDLKSIEGAMRKVLASQPVSVTAAPGGVAVAPAEGAEGAALDESQMAALKEAIAEREAKIAELMKALEEAKAVTAAADSGGGGGADPAQIAELKAKVEELQARLAEYEIIEDDIADLSIYKEENGRLKSEIDELKKKLETAQSAPAPAASKIKSEGEAELKFEKAEKFELDPNDDVMKAFAEAVDDKKVDPTPAAFSLPQEEIDAMVREAAAAPAPAAAPSESAEPASASAEPEDPQAKIDALFAAQAGAAEAETPVTPASGDDAQSEIDRLLAEAAAGGQASATEAPAAEPEASTTGAVAVSDADTQAEIDKMLAAAVDEAGSAEMKPFDDPQAMADALLAGEGTNEGTPAKTDEAEDPLASLLATDTEKMLSEVETLGAEPVADTGDALTESLDTEKLLAEVSSLEGAADEKQPEEDLLAEFKDAAKGGG